MIYILQFITSAFVVSLVAKYIPGINYTSSSAFLVFVVVLSLANIAFGTLLRIVTFPLKLITLGTSSLFISFAMVYFADYIVTGISISNIIAVASVSFATSIIAMVFRLFK